MPERRLSLIKMKMLKYALIIGICLVMLTGCRPVREMVSSLRMEVSVRKGEFIKRALAVGDIERTYFLHFPDHNTPDSPLPVVLVLHGGDGADAKKMSERMGFNEIADRENFIVAYPQGVDGQWNDGRNKSFRQADNSHINDVGFIAAVINDIVKNYRGDAGRVFVTGVSNGGMMAMRLALEIGSEITAIAAVIANLPVNLADKIPVRALPVLIMNGTKDQLVPWNGGSIRVLGQERGEVLSTAETVAYWVKHNALPAAPANVKTIDTDKNDGCSVEVITYRGEEEPIHKVVLYKIIGGGHTIPGSRAPDMSRLLGKKCMDINAAEEIWAFFKSVACYKKL